LENLVRAAPSGLEHAVVVVEGQDYQSDPAEERGTRVETLSLGALVERLPGLPVLSAALVAEHVPDRGLLADRWDLVHAHDWYGVLPALAHLPLRFGFTYANHPIPVLEKTRLEAMGFRIADRVVAPSRYIAGLLEREYDVSSKKLRVVPNGVDAAVFRPDAAPREVVPTLLAVSRLSDQKGLDYLLEVLLRVRVTHPAARLRVAGDGPEKARLAERARVLGLAGAVELLGYVPHAELPVLYASSTVFVSTSVYEPFGLTTLEAMASGCPVVVSALGGAADFVRDGVDGFVRHPQHREPFAEAVRALVSEPVTHRRMAESARSRAGELDWRNVAERLARVYSEIAPESEALRRVG
jgi:glycosyltransferase involved in cell wall biosynthesis